MSRRLTVTALVLLGWAGISRAQAQQPIAKLTSYSGRLAVVRNAVPQAVYPNLPLYSGDTVSTRRGLATVVFDDGTELQVRRNSRIEIAHQAKRREINIFLGRLWARVAKSKEQLTRFRTGGTIAAVRGTEIEWEALSDGLRIGVETGSLEFTIEVPGAAPITFTLEAGQMITIPAHISAGWTPNIQAFTKGMIAGGTTGLGIPSLAIPGAIGAGTATALAFTLGDATVTVSP